MATKTSESRYQASTEGQHGDEEACKKQDQPVLSHCNKFSYGVGHVLNDLTASMWFSYLLVFLHQVNNFHNILAGNLMLIGQVSDALFTPFIGLESDRTSGIWKLGRRKTWHLIGTLCVMASFPFLFSKCITCSHAPNIAQFVYYAPFVVIFQFGWASTQISHLSFSSDLSPNGHDRVTLQSIRNLFTVISNLSVYGIFLALFLLEGTAGGGAGSVTDELGEADAPKFQQLAFISVGLGTIFNVIFYMGTKERTDRDKVLVKNSDQHRVGDSSIEQSTVNHSKMRWKDWFKNKQFYEVALLYMATRLYINVSQVYFPMYLTETIQLSKYNIALLPFVTYLSSFLMSLLSPYVNRFCGRKISYVIGVALGASSCVWMYFIGEKSNDVFGAAFFMGFAGSLLLITSLSMTSDLIASNTESGAFVFGAMSFTDKLTNGVAVMLIQNFHPCLGCCPACEPYYRNVQVFIPGGALVIGFIALLILIPQNIGHREKAVSVKVMENPVRSDSRASGSEHITHQCTCGNFYTPPSTCSTCGIQPDFNPYNQVADAYRGHTDSDDDDANNDTDYRQERKPLLRRSHVNTPPADLRYYTENA